MPEWFNSSFQESGHADWEALAVRLGLAFLLGCVVGSIYYLTQRKPRSELVPLVTTLVLLTVLMAMVTLVIGNSVARAFSLAGALSIVRFRTVVEDTRDTAFVIFAVVVGMSVGVGAEAILVSLVGIPVVACAAFLFSLRTSEVEQAPRDYSLTIRLGVGQDPELRLRETFGKHLERSRLLGTATARQGAALDLTYRVRLRREEAIVTLVAELNRTEGVQEVEIRPT